MNLINLSLLPHNKIKDYTNVQANRYFTKILQRVLTIVGVNVLNPDYRMSARTFILIFTTHSLILSFIFMVFTDVAISVKLEAFCLVMVIYQGLHKMYTAIILSKYYLQIFKIISDLHMKYQDHPVIAPTLKRLCFYCAILFECFSAAYYGVGLSYLIIPIFMWIQYDVLATIFPVQFPLIDWHTPIGYACNMVSQCIIPIVGPVSLLAADVIFMYFVLHTIGYLAILKCRVAQLDRLLENETQDLEKIQTQFYKCIQAHQDYISYILLLDDGYAQLCLAQVVTSEIVLTLSLFLTLWSKWISGPFLAVAGLFQLLEYCILGTVVTVQNDKALEIIYGMKWYLLPVRHQKLVVLMILRAQNSPEMNVGSFAKLNVATCMQVLKATYSYLMMMLEFIK